MLILFKLIIVNLTTNFNNNLLSVNLILTGVCMVNVFNYLKFIPNVLLATAELVLILYVTLLYEFLCHFLLFLFVFYLLLYFSFLLLILSNVDVYLYIRLLFLFEWENLKNLAAAFVLRFAILALWTLLSIKNAFRDCTHFVPIHLRQWEWLCKSLLFGVIYFQVASVMWMLIEGVYLYSRFTVLAMRRTEAPYILYLFTGWGIPLFVVAVWATIHARQSESRSFCWMPYAQGPHLWILSITMGLALILNVIFLLLIILILVRKIRTESTAESKKIWRTVKATMLLVPLLGVSNVPLFYEPTHPSAFYMLGSAILQHSQGIFIAVLYCFLNAEIQNALKRQISKVPLLRTILSGGRDSRRHFETERTFIPAVQTDEDMQMKDLPMRSKNGTVKKVDGKITRIFNGRAKQSNSMNDRINWHANNNNNNNLIENEEIINKEKNSDLIISTSCCGHLINLEEEKEENSEKETDRRRRAESTGSKLRFFLI
ncbi:hypothetical protein Mgra_00010107 [Meloidogyne graminicola]|uniref:G-protein coupled receptors family 2 profile 2 domain-containing protein n=1 Tax=Meloidogyne graminicola TaxID=189291 RepID=A0A8S9ZD30_9BILA|nr:hypothetical protein Mgra_00010107 [Meloidogyne graminicola]